VRAVRAERNPPHTAALDRQKLISAESFLRYWNDCLVAGTRLNTGEADWPENVVCELLHGGYVDHAHQHGDRHPLTIEQLGIKLRKVSPEELDTIRPRVEWNGHKRPLRYSLLSLEAHRTAFLNAMKIDDKTHVWPDEAEHAQ